MRVVLVLFFRNVLSGNAHPRRFSKLILSLSSLIGLDVLLGEHCPFLGAWLSIDGGFAVLPNILFFTFYSLFSYLLS